MDQVLEDAVVVPAGSPHDDRGLIRDFLAGKPETIRTVDGWIDIVLHTECVDQRPDWDDLRQEIQIRVLTNLRDGRFRGDSELRTYIHRIARNTAIDHWRRTSTARSHNERRSSAGSDRVPFRTEPDGVLSRDLLRKILRGLTHEERVLLSLVHAQHLSYAEIARKLNVAEGTIKARVFRCRERLLELRKRLLGHEDE